MLDYVFGEMIERERGFAAHYLFLHAVVRGLSAQRVVEFGAGVTTRVILEALRWTDGHLYSCSTDERSAVAARAGFVDEGWSWTHHAGLSTTFRPPVDQPIDLLLHDGAHDAATVVEDLARVVPVVRRFGLILVHDTQHSNCGHDMRSAVRAAARAHSLSHTTLPYGYGLTIMRAERGVLPPVRPNAFDKHASAHRTEPRSIEDEETA